MSSAFAADPGRGAAQPGLDWDAQEARATAQQREADVIAFYDTAREPTLRRPARQEAFTSEADLLAWLGQYPGPKRLLVVILSKRHDWSDPNQTLEGFRGACRKTGFERVVIQRGTAFGHPILRE